MTGRAVLVCDIVSCRGGGTIDAVSMVKGQNSLKVNMNMNEIRLEP